MGVISALVIGLAAYIYKRYVRSKQELSFMDDDVHDGKKLIYKL